ncbi:helix-turn-helix domain-containing protein [Methylomonas rhizoryzae]|uniref:helix-turn-helix domain-containing protein n=1 Tax=Methylomonas rhizoryzae TaxID=2608981 RepID=UPI001232428E|nr:helix-turn-helix transcriptional regulator [Methylomonas rhizoryzae]
MIGQRIEELRKFKGLSRRKLQEVTGIADYTWQAVEIGKQIANEDHIKALSKLWPEYKYWLVFGETCVENGQISPELEETRQKLEQAG